MNIGIVTTWFPAGAGYVSKAYRQVLEQEHKVHIYARGGQKMHGDPLWDDKCVTWAPVHYVATGIWSWHFRKWIRAKKIELIVFNEQRQWQPIVVAKEEGVLVGAYVDYYTKVMVPGFSVYDFLICNTRKHYSVFSWHPCCYYIPWGVDVEKFKPLPKAPTRITTFLSCAGWEGVCDGDRRGTLLALQAFRQVKGECRLIVYSQVPYEQMMPEWKRLLFDDDRIELRVGTFEPFPFNEGDVYLYPSRLDGIGLTLPEAISSGLACITTDAGPMNEFVEMKKTGILVSVEKYLGRSDGYYWPESLCSLDKLTEAIQWYLDHNEQLEEHKRNAREYALKNLDWKKNSYPLVKEILTLKSRDLSLKDLRLVHDLDQRYAPNLKHRIFLLFGYMRSYFRSLLAT
jgi:glycosyltransferase involved in cell wall biosynthesis